VDEVFDVTSLPDEVALILAVVLVVVPAVVTWKDVTGPVLRARVERFARRTGLEVTPDNGNLVIRYLATTRRWRTCGVAIAYLVILVPALARGSVKVDVLVLAIGWFAGALVAEWRVAGMADGPGRRAASLAPRSRRTHLGTAARWVAAFTTGYAAGLALLALSAVLLGRAPAADLAACLPLIVIGGAVRLAQQRTLLRPQPLGPPDVTAADDAVRTRSMAVLTGCQVALVLLFCPALAGPALTVLPGTLSAWPAVVVLVLAVSGPLIGVWLAFARGPAQRSERREDRLVTLT